MSLRHHKPDHAAQDFGRAHRQMELAHADIDPHIAGAGVEIWIARQSKPRDVVMGGDLLIADANIHMAEIDDIADVLRGAVVPLVLHERILRSRPSLSVCRTGKQDGRAVGLHDCHHVYHGGSFCNSGNAA